MPDGDSQTYRAEIERQAKRRGLPPDHLAVHRWYLRRPAGPAQIPPPPRTDLSVLRAQPPSIEFYRFLYHTVGEDYLWADRRRKSDQELLTLISPESIEVNVLYANGTPAGFFELDFTAADANELAYFGLLPSFVGVGLGSYLLKLAIHRASLVREDLPMTLNTCSLDHPRALANYQCRGFTIIRELDETYEDPRLKGIIPATAATPRIPIAS